MANNFAKDYVDVATRLKDFFEKWPAGSLQQKSLEFVNIAGKDYVVYTAVAYRTPDDIAPAMGTAWEPIPGLTPYTKGSEVMVAETSAWGRALVALGADTKNGVASANEVQNRQVTKDKAPVAKPAPTKTAKHFNDLGTMAAQNKDIDTLRELYAEAVADNQPKEVLDSLTELAKQAK